MEQLENIIEFVRRYVTPEILILVILVIGTFLVFSFFIQDLFQDYFKDYRGKKKKDQEAGTSGENKTKPKPRPRLRKMNNRPRLVKNTKDGERNHTRKTTETKEKTKSKR